MTVLNTDIAINVIKNHKAIFAMSNIKGRKGAGSSLFLGNGLYNNLYARIAAPAHKNVLIVNGKY